MGARRVLALWSLVGVRVACHPAETNLKRRKPKNLHA